jgi:hypothetical protein
MYVVWFKEQTGKHADAAVLDLSLAEPPHVDNVGEAKGVEANVTNVGACAHSISTRKDMRLSFTCYES